MGAIGHDGLAVPGKVELAHEPAFTLGNLQVEPATRQLVFDGRSETIEPRVMQVLVALYRAGGVVTRDELVERCWEGRIVGDDAINRILSRIRRLASDFGEGSFSVETITKVGYRLTARGIAGQAEVLGDPPKTLVNRRLVTIGLGCTAAGAAGLGWLKGRQPNAQLKEAMGLYDRAMALRGGSIEDNRQAVAYLREAVRIAPKYGQAWGSLALAYRDATLDEPAEQVVGFEARINEAASTALRYDPGNAEAELALVYREPFFGQWTKMEEIYRGFVRRQPNLSNGHFLLGSLLMDVGRWRDAVESLRQSKAANSFSPFARYRLIIALWSADLVAEAEREITEAFALWPQHGAVWQTKVKILSQSGRAKEALAMVEDAVNRPTAEAAGDLDIYRAYLTALITGSAKDNAIAISKVLAAVEQDRRAVPWAFQLALLGRPDLALELLEGCYLGVGRWASYKPANPREATTHPLFQPQARSLWAEPRFGRILEGIGLERYWHETGMPPDYRSAQQ